MGDGTTPLALSTSRNPGVGAYSALVPRLLEGRVRPEPGSRLHISHIERKRLGTGANSEQLLDPAGHCSLEKAKERSDGHGQVGDGSKAEDSDQLSLSPSTGRIRGSGLQWWQEGFRLDIRENFL